ncbi:flagellar hook-basal body complex protein FliE [Nocardioides sp. GCM10027113]|uniref:flagellar hook-basal body complex protein FliE n=1 Tax=unclassified Nocardioides TaxID=2615069 RepID=UPI00361063F2
MSVSGIEGLGGFTPYVPPTVGPSGPSAAGTGGLGRAGGPGGAFGDMVIDGIERLEGVQDRADQLAVKAATGDLSNLHDYTMAASEAALTTKLTVAVRNKAIESFTEIMRMQVG